MPVFASIRAAATTAAALLVPIVSMTSLAPARGAAESGLALEVPNEFGILPATTFDDDGQAIGRSKFALDFEDGDTKTMRVSMQVEGGGQNIAEAKFEPLTRSSPPDAGALLTESALAAGASGRAGDDTKAMTALRIIEERSQSTSVDGRVFPLLVIDHEERRVSCYPDGEPPSAATHRDIPDGDRVVNVPMQLLFLPLVRGEVESIDFQIATCADGPPTLYDMIAVRSSTFERDGRRIVEVEYGPDFGAAIAFLASRLLPSFSFWFDADDGTYLGHRMPLHLKGPQITLVRQGLTPAAIGAD